LSAVLLPAISANAQQHQLIVLKYDDVVARFNPGQPFAFKYKGQKEKISTYIRDIQESQIITYDDTISIYEIDRIYFEQRGFHQTIGTALIIAGVGRFVIDQINNLVVHGNQPSLDSEVNQFSISTVVLGLPMRLIKKKSQRMLYKYKAIIIDQESYLYAQPAAQLLPDS